MKVVILAGGKGTRISEYTSSIPKPMIKIGGKPIIEHIIDYYKKFSFNDFIIASGYKSEIIKKYFRNKKYKNIKVINTGINSLTGKRIKKLQKYLNRNAFLLTYGDGVSNINLNKLIRFHKKNRKIATMTVVHPPARFGEVKFKKNLITSFKEKPQLKRGWINGGFFVFEPTFFNILNFKNVMLEREPITKLVKKRQISAYSHKGFWYCMDNLRDKKVLENLYKTKKAPWI
jgi:glucose-1-phosphate cytidylyltransferase